ncbi:MAG: hypothetical protein ACRYGP_16930 [Janthinobacterium lividum]
MAWHHWKGDIAAAIIGLLLTPIVLYAIGATAFATSTTFRCEDQCKMDRFYAAQAKR